MRGKLRKTSVGSGSGTGRSASMTSLGAKVNGNILILGERLRLCFQLAKPAFIKDRRRHFRLCQQCFVGKDAVDWLVQYGHANDRRTATQLMQILMKNMLLHNAYEESEVFRDDDSFYRFCMDENSFPLTRETEPFIKGEQVYSRLSADPNDPFELVKVHTENSATFEKSFFGMELTAWLMREGFCHNRQQAIMFGKDLLENHIIRHVTNDHHFKDERLLYQFHPNMSCLKFTNLLELDNNTDEEVQSSGHELLHTSSPALRKVTSSSPRIPRNFSEPQFPSSPKGRKISTNSEPDQNGFKRTMSDSEEQTFEAFKEGSMSDSSSDRCSPPPQSVLANKFSVLELQDSKAPFTKQTVQIQGDSVGYGFVIRGNGPVFVKAIDPGGPAAQAGLKVHQYIESVNGINILKKNHNEAAQIIVCQPQKLTLVVLNKKETILM